jgi:hypothetical protein
MHPLASAGAVTASREIAAIAHAKVLFFVLLQRADIEVVSQHRWRPKVPLIGGARLAVLAPLAPLNATQINGQDFSGTFLIIAICT